MKTLTWWMRAVGVFYLVSFVAATFLRVPIKAEGPEGVLALADAGDPVARFLVDTWVTLGIELFVLGTALLIASRVPAQAKALVWTILSMELFRGIGIDIYKMTRGYALTGLIVWIIIHSVIIISGLYALNKASEEPPKTHN